MSTISESHAGLGKPANPNGIYAYHEAIGAQASPAVPPLFDDADQVGPRAELAVRYAPESAVFLTVRTSSTASPTPRPLRAAAALVSS